MTIHSFDGYSEFEQWCEDNGYDADEQYDQEEESYKRDTNLFFYVKHKNDDVYAEVNVCVSYDFGWQYGNVEKVGLKRVEEQVVTTVVKYT